MDDGSAQKAMRVQLGVILTAVVLWQALAALFAWAVVPIAGTAFLTLGVEPSRLARFVFTTHRAWAAVPVLTLILVLDVLRRPRAPATHATTVLVIAAFVAVLLQAALFYAVLEPFGEEGTRCIK